MKLLVSKIAVVLTLAASTAVLHAQQVRTAVFGRTTLSFNSTFTSAVSSLGGEIEDLDLNPITGTSILLPVKAGALNPETAIGEVEHSSGFTLTGGGKAIRLENFIVDTTSGTAPVVTAVIIFNNTVLGRITLFNVLYPAGLSLPLQTTAGVLQVNGLTLSLAPVAATTLNSLFGINAIPANLSVGTASLYVVLAPLPNGTL